MPFRFIGKLPVRHKAELSLCMPTKPRTNSSNGAPREKAAAPSPPNSMSPNALLSIGINSFGSNPPAPRRRARSPLRQHPRLPRTISKLHHSCTVSAPINKMHFSKSLATNPLQNPPLALVQFPVTGLTFVRCNAAFARFPINSHYFPPFPVNARAFPTISRYFPLFPVISRYRIPPARCSGLGRAFSCHGPRVYSKTCCQFVPFIISTVSYGQLRSPAEGSFHKRVIDNAGAAPVRMAEISSIRSPTLPWLGPSKKFSAFGSP